MHLPRKDNETPEQWAARNLTTYAALVAKTKGLYAKLKRPHAGEEVTYAIRKAWAKMCDVEFDEPEPAKPTGNEPKAKYETPKVPIGAAALLASN